MTSEEKQEIINAVLAALRTNSKTIGQLTPVSEMSDEDFLELNGGRKVSYGVLFANHMSNDDAQEAWEYLDTKKVDKDSRGLVEVHQAPVVFLDAMGTLDGHSLNGSEGLEYRTDTKLIYDFPGGLLGAPKAGAVYISKNNFKKFIWNGTELVELKVDECPLFVDYMEPVAFADIPVGGSYYVQSSHKIAVKIDASNTKTYDPLPDALYFFRDKGMIYTWKSSTNKWVPAGSDIKVVNNLVEGGGDKALSAEMGKRLAPLLELIGAVEHPSETESVALTSGKRYDGNLYNQPTNGTFPTTTNSSSSWGCAAVDVKEGDVLKIIGTKSGADYRIYTIVDASNQRLSVGSSANGQSYTSESPLSVTMPANAAKVYVNLSYSGAAVSVVRSAWTESVINRATTSQDGLMTKEQVAAFEELSAIVEEMGANSELLSTLIENVTIPATTKNVQMTSGGRYDGNYYNTGNTGVFPTTINSNSGWSYGNIACKEGDVLTIVGGKSGADYKIYTIVDADNKRISSGASSNQTYTSDSPLSITMPANAAKVYINLSSVTSVKLTEPSYNEDQLRKATTEQDGLMTKEQVAALDAAGGDDVELLKSYIVDRTDTMTGTFVVGNLKNWNVAIGATYNGGLGDDNQSFVYSVLSVKAGDIVTLWCTTDAWNQGYIICDSSNKVIAKSGNNYSKSQSSPAIITIEQDGKIWIASNKSASYGASLSRTYRAFRNATAEQDGLMPKEIAALFGGDVSGDDAASLKLKSFAFIGDSFSAPGSWQSTMCSVLGAMVKANKAVSGGAWHGSDSLSAYYQAQQLVSANQAADYILCVLGTNDIANNVSLGDIVNSQTIGSASGNVNPATVTGGIQATLITLKKAFPNAIIKIGYTPAGQLHDSFSSMAAVEALCNRLKEVGIMYGVDYIETRTCGISRSLTEDRLAWEGNTDGASYTGHPSGAGQTRIGQYMARKMLSDL